MNCQLTVLNPATQAQVDLVVAADDRAAATPLLAALRAAVAADQRAPLTVAGRVVPLDGTVADCAVAAGDLVIAGEAPARQPPVIDIVVDSGPDAGRAFALTTGSHVLGRDADCDITIHDAAVSRHQLVLDITSSDLRIADLLGVNPTWLEGSRLDGSVGGGERISHGALPVTLRLGDSVVTVARAHQPNDVITADAGSHRYPLAAVSDRLIVTMPHAPTPAIPPRLAMLPALVPIVAGGALAVVLHQWGFIAFTALSPLMVVAQAVTDRRATRRQNRLAQREHAAALEHAQLELAAGLVTERVRRNDASPTLGAICAMTTAAVGRLRRQSVADPEFRLRLGRADQPSEIEVRGGPTPTIADAPLLTGLTEVRMLGVTGLPTLRRGVARSLVAQAAALHDPADLAIVVIAPGGTPDWGWVRWLPHLTPRAASCVAAVGFDARQIAQRVAELAVADPAPHRVLVLVDGANPELAAALPAAAAVIWCAADTGSLPAGCGAVATLSGTAQPRLEYTTPTGRIADALPDLLSVDVADAVARRLAPQRPRHGGGALPRSVWWSELEDPYPTKRPSERRSTEIALGIGSDGVIRVDLVRDGPHALIAGATGAGKSELLLTIIAELATRHRPDQLSLLLVDHKGGAAFGGCAALPHTVGVVTDLDPVATRRALRSIGAELRRREHCLAAAGVADFEAYQLLVGVPIMTRLVIVVDEFAALVGAEPDRMVELVAIAQRGRSLGLHLILATQRPEGIVSADIRANTRIRICLGVTRDQDSRDVIDAAVAAAISRTTPGRAYLRVGPGELHAFQAARVTGNAPALRPVSVMPVPDGALGDPLPREPASESAMTELDRLAVEVNAAAERDGYEPIPTPWLPPLPDHIPQSTLLSPAGAAAWGLADLPDEARQPPLAVTPDTASSTLIIGTTRSGRSTAAVAIAVGLARVASPDRLHIWGIDPASGLAALADLPHCGAVIAAGDHERIRSLLDHLLREVRDRRASGIAAGPAMVLVIDGWETTVNAVPERGRSDLSDQVMRLATEGPSAGVHIVITGERGLLTSRLAGIADERIVLRLADPADYLILGLPRCDIPTDLPPGRGVRSSDLAVIQVAVPDPKTELAAARWPEPTRPPARFTPLPSRIGLRDLRSADEPTAGTVTLGVGAPDLVRVRLTPAELRGTFLILGTRRSGRSTALALIGEQLSDRAVMALAPRHSPLADSPWLHHVDSHDSDHALEVLDRLSTAPTPPHLMIDDIDQITPGPLLDRIERLIKDHHDASSVIAIGATIDSAATAFRGPLNEARHGGHALLLRPASARDGDVLGVDLRSSVFGADPPGRGWLVTEGDARRVQLAMPERLAQPSTDCELAAFGVRRRE